MMAQLDNLETLHQQLEEEQQARAELERELHLLHQFIRSAGHDLKTPITTLKTSLYLLQRKPELAVPERLDMMAQQLERMTNLVDAMGLMARLDGESDLVLDEVDVLAVVDESIRYVADFAGQNNVTIYVEISDYVPDVQINFEECKRALINLLDNAIRYSDPGTDITIDVFEMHDYLCVDVIDKGCGMTNDEVKQLFEPFFRGNDAGQNGDTGAGMGLCVVKRIMELHGGKVRVMSKQGEGSTFRLMFPVV